MYSFQQAHIMAIAVKLFVFVENVENEVKTFEFNYWCALMSALMDCTSKKMCCCLLLSYAYYNYVKLKPIIDPKKTVHNMIQLFVFIITSTVHLFASLLVKIFSWLRFQSKQVRVLYACFGYYAFHWLRHFNCSSLIISTSIKEWAFNL